MTIPHTTPRITDAARERRVVIRRVIRAELPGLLNAEAVRRIAGSIDEALNPAPDVHPLVAEGIILPSEVQYLDDGRSRWPIPSTTP